MRGWRQTLTTTRSLLFYRPYPKQKQFHEAGTACTERLLRAGNQQGKTLAGGMEMAAHLTGRYPEWWNGRRYDRPIEAWAACDTGENTRDNPQRVLLGPVGAFGTGAIPADAITEKWAGRGVANLMDTVLIRHKSGGISRLGFKRYDQGRESWQGPPKDVIWCDEEPPEDVYSEAMARLIATRGMIYTTFTPLKGMSNVVERLLGKGTPDQADINMTIEDAEHIPASERARIIASFPAHEREARARGVPILGSGRVFPLSEDLIRCDPIQLPDWWVQWGACDFGWDHPFAAVHLAHDRESDCIYVTKAHKVREQTPILHAAALKPWGAWLPWAWPHDGLQHDKGSGDALAAQYKAQGMKMHHEHATHAPPAGGFGTEAGVTDMLDRMQTGRLKVFAGLSEWFEEYRLYHRLDGKIVKERDDLMSATRVGVMMRRIAKTKPTPRTKAEFADSGLSHDW
jgi:phage terminase large subunit-like protein